MPKTSTKTKATRNTKSNKTSSGWQRRFDLTNKRVQFFVVIAIVAILGGGYFTVKSFASDQSYAYTLPNFGFYGGSTSDVTSGNKAGGEYATISTSDAPRRSVSKVVEPGAYNICHVSRTFSTRSTSLTIAVVGNNSQIYTYDPIPVSQGNDFVKRCNYKSIVLLQRTNIHLVLSNKSDASAQFGYAYLQRVYNQSSSK